MQRRRWCLAQARCRLRGRQRFVRHRVRLRRCRAAYRDPWRRISPDVCRGSCIAASLSGASRFKEPARNMTAANRAIAFLMAALLLLDGLAPLIGGSFTMVQSAMADD